MVFQRKPPAKKRAPALRRLIGPAGSPLAHENETFPASVQTPPPGGVHIAFLPEKPVTEKEWKEMEDQGIVKRAPSPTHYEPQREGAMFAVIPDPPKKKRGRPPKHATEAERKAADAARKRDERAEASEEKQIEKIEAGLPSEYHTGSEDASKRAGQGGSSNEDLGRLAQGTSATLNAPDALIADNVGDTVDNLLGPTSSVIASEHIRDRKHTAVPINPDENTSEKPESDSTFVWRAFTREAASIKAWIKKGGGQKRPCEERHQRLADAAFKDSPAERAWCSACGKLLIDPGKTVKGISRTPTNSCPETPPSSVSS